MTTATAARITVWGCVGWLVLPAPVSAQTRTLELVGTIPGPATTVHVYGTIAYVSSGPTLQLVDIGNPAEPRRLSSLTLPQNIYGVRVFGGVACVAVDFDGLAILDVSDPGSPTLLSSIEAGGQALSVAVAGATAVVANRLSGLEVFDVSAPASPVSRGAYYTEGYAVEVVTAGSFAYVVDSPGGLSIIDLSKPGEPEAVGTLSTIDRPATISVTRLSSEVPGATLAGLMGTDSLLEIVDVSDPSAPSAVGQYRHPERPATGQTLGSPSLELEGALAFLADAVPSPLLQVVDLAAPARPTLVATYEPPGAPMDLSVSGALVYLAVASRDPSAPGVIILRLSD